MGADQFENWLIGKDLPKLFSEAVRAAQYDYGHAGYTGTIAEKGGYVEVGSLPPRMTIEKLDKLMWQLQEWENQKYWHDQKQGKKPGAHPVPENWRPFVKKVAELYDDKWGPAVVIEITGVEKTKIKERHGRKGTRDRVWVAMGLASS